MNLKLLSTDYFYDPAFRLKVIERDPELPYPLHSHDFFELVVIVSGKGSHFTQANEISLMPGNVLAIPPECEHGYRNVEGLRLYNVLFDPLLFKETFYDLRNMPGYHALLRLEPSYRKEAGLDSIIQVTPVLMA